MSFPTLALTSPHKRGKQVEEAQWLLGHNRWGLKFYSGVPDSEYGPLTGAAAHRAKFWMGYPTNQIDNCFGAKLRSFLVPTTHAAYKDLPVAYKIRRAARIKAAAASVNKLTRGQKRVIEAKKWLGYRETNVNLTVFGAWYGANGNPWCAYFCSWCDDKAGGKFHFGYVPYVVAAAFANQYGLYTTISPVEGDFVCYDWNYDGTFDHIGLFLRWIDKSAGTFETIEGNTLPPGGSGNQSNGGGVYIRERSTKTAHVVFVREKS